MVIEREKMSSTRSEVGYHLIPFPRPTEWSKVSQKTILNLLNTKCSTCVQHLKQAHALILKSNHVEDHYIAGSLVKWYANFHFGSSIKVLNHVPKPNVFVWNSVIKGCVDNDEPYLGIWFYYKMVVSDCRPNRYTYPTLLKACAVAQAVEEGAQIHAHAVKRGLSGDGYVKSAGIQMYASFGCLTQALNILDSDPVCCNAMIHAYFKSGVVKAAKILFHSMSNKNVSSWNAMVSGFARVGMIEAANDYFNEMPHKDEISWSAMIDAYNKVGDFKEALEIFREMQKDKVRPGKFLLSSVAASCASVGALDQGRWVHAYARRNKIKVDGVLGTSLVDMYAKCGRLDLAWEVFEKMADKMVFSWNAMIGGFAMHGRAEDAINLFLKMQRENMKPDVITFVGVLNACAHGGLVDEGLKWLYSMDKVYGIEPKVEHYCCIVDLLGRAGLLVEAEELINSMPMEPNAAVWGALLSACKIHGDSQLGEKVGRILLELDPQNSGRYALLLNIYAKAGRWGDVVALRKLMKQRGVNTTSSGISMIDLNGILHEFKVGDWLHPQTNQIYLMLERVIDNLKVQGYMPNASQVLFDVGEEEES